MSSPILPASPRPELAPTRRELIAAGAAGLALATLPWPASAQAPASMAELIARVTEGAAPERRAVALDIPRLVENGNSVDVAVRVESRMSEADHVRRIHVIAEKNPFPDVVAVARFHLSPRSGRADVRATLRFATSQKVAVIAALSTGGYVMDDADIVVTLSACIDGG